MNKKEENVEVLVEEENTDVEETTETNRDEDASQENTNTSEKTFTQEQVNKMMANEKDEGRRSVLKELGIEDSKQLANAVKVYKAIKESERTEDDKKNDVVAENAELRRKLLETELKAEALEFGVQKQYADDVKLLVISKLNEDNDVKTVLSELKKKYPVMFTENEENNQSERRNTGTDSNPSDIRRANENNKGDIGRRLANENRRATNKSSFFKHS